MLKFINTNAAESDMDAYTIGIAMGRWFLFPFGVIYFAAALMTLYRFHTMDLRSWEKFLYTAVMLIPIYIIIRYLLYNPIVGNELDLFGALLMSMLYSAANVFQSIFTQRLLRYPGWGFFYDRRDNPSGYYIIVASSIFVILVACGFIVGGVLGWL
jgi:hypothetical protein